MKNLMNNEHEHKKLEKELKPCPFCGGEAIIKYYAPCDYVVHCEKEDCYGGIYDTEEEAIEAWNRRITK